MKEVRGDSQNSHAVALGPYSPRDVSAQQWMLGGACFAFNLGIRNWINGESLPAFWWITEKKVILECRDVIEAATKLGRASHRGLRLLMPQQFETYLRDELDLPHDFIDLAPLTRTLPPGALSLQSAALWWTAMQGFSAVHCLGFDHFFRDARAGFFKPELLPSPTALASSAYRSNASHGEFTDFFFYHRKNLTNLPLSEPRCSPSHLHAHIVLQRCCPLAPGGPAASSVSHRSRQKLDAGANTGPLVSVLVCIKDAALTIRESLGSLAEQTYRNLELIVIDGNSKDGTQQVVREFEGLVGDFISEPDEGYYDALNKAMARANGDFFLVVNGDDTLQPHAIERLVEAAVADGVDIAAAHARTMDAEGRFTGDLASFWNASSAIRCPLRHGAMLASRRICERVGPYEANKRVIADRLWMQKAMGLGASVSIVEEYLLHFRTTGISSGTSPEHSIEVDQCLKDLEPTLPEAVRSILHAPWDVGGGKLVDLCRQFPLAGPLRQALLAAAQPKERNSVPPALSIVLADVGPQALKEFIVLLQQQTFSNYEILVCGELSQQSKAWLRDAATKDLRIQYVATESSGWLQRALWHATGDYLLLLDAKPAQDPGFLASALASATQTSSLLMECLSSGKSHSVWCESGAIRYNTDWLTSLFLNRQPQEPITGLLAAREVYKASLDWLEQWQCSNQCSAYCLSIFAVAAFSLFPNKVSALAPDSVSLRSKTLREAMTLCRKDSLFPTASCRDLPRQMATTASRIFTESVARNHRLGKNSRLRLVSDWNKALRETLQRTACTAEVTPEAET